MRTNQAESRTIETKGILDEMYRALLQMDGQAILDQPFLNRVWEQLERYNVKIIYDFDTQNYNNQGETTKYLDGTIEITVFKQNALPSKESLATLVHESSHAVAAARGRYIGTLADEYQAFRREFLFKKQRRPTIAERRRLFVLVQGVYDDVAAGNIAPLFSDLIA